MRFIEPENLRERIFNLLDEDVEMVRRAEYELSCEIGSGDIIRDAMKNKRFVIVDKIIEEIKEDGGK